jgi:hypothetical protein
MYYSADQCVVFVAGTLILILTISGYYYYYSDGKPLILRWYIICCIGIYERECKTDNFLIQMVVIPVWILE